MATIAHRLELDLDVFAGPFDLLLSLILREELDLLEVELAEVVLAYVDHLEAEGELDLEAATEFLVLIAALLELKSRLMLPGEELPDDLEGLGPAEAAEELLDRMLQYARFRGAGAWVAQAHAAGQHQPRLELQQRRDQHEELGRRLEIELALGLQVVDVGDHDLGQLDFEQVELLPQDQREEQVEGTREDVEVQL